MIGARIVFLMYHELEIAGRELCQSEPGYVRYILSLEKFREQMEWLKKGGWRGLSLGESLSYLTEQPSGLQSQDRADSAVCITFDDGCETDLIAAAPVLHELGFNATFYLTAGFLGTPGYLSAAQARDLDARGFEIGCHSMTHAYLSDISEPALKREIADAKLALEAILGHTIQHFSCPGGRYDERALRVAREAGFTTVANSEFHANSSETSRYELGRVAVLRGLTMEQFASTCQGHGLWKKRLQHGARRGVQRALGNHAYDSLRAMLLGEPHG